MASRKKIVWGQAYSSPEPAPQATEETVAINRPNIGPGDTLTDRASGHKYLARRVNTRSDGSIHSVVATELSHHGLPTTASIVIWGHELPLFSLPTMVSRED